MRVDTDTPNAWQRLLDERGQRVLVVAEVAQTHDGSLGQAHAFIDAVARTGADAIKFQTHIASEESTPAEPWRIKFSPQDETRFEYWKRMEFTADQWAGLARHAEDRGLLFMSSPFSFAAIDLLQKLGMRVWKVASGEVGNIPFVERIAQTGDPVLLSSGLSTFDELDVAVATIRQSHDSVVVLQCTTSYPCPPEDVGLNMIETLSTRYRCPVGLSDHSATIFPGLAAVALGAVALEVHVTLSRDMFGPDVSASVTVPELTELVRGARFIATALHSPVDKDSVAEEKAGLRALFTRSAVAGRDLPAGHVLQREDLVAKKPGSGIPAARIPELVGSRVARAIPKDSLLSLEDLEG